MGMMRKKLRRTEKHTLKLAKAREAKALSEEKEKISEHAEFYTAKDRYRRAKILGYFLFIIYGALLIALALVLRTLSSILVSFIGFFLYGFLLKAHAMECEIESESPNSVSLDNTRRCMNIYFYVGLIYGLGSVFVVLHNMK